MKKLLTIIALCALVPVALKASEASELLESKLGENDLAVAQLQEDPELAELELKELTARREAEALQQKLEQTRKKKEQAAVYVLGLETDLAQAKARITFLEQRAAAKRHLDREDAKIAAQWCETEIARKEKELWEYTGRRRSSIELLEKSLASYRALFLPASPKTVEAAPAVCREASTATPVATTGVSLQDLAREPKEPKAPKKGKGGSAPKALSAPRTDGTGEC